MYLVRALINFSTFLLRIYAHSWLGKYGQTQPGAGEYPLVSGADARRARSSGECPVVP